MEDEKKNVFKAYNMIAEWFLENRPKDLTEKVWLDDLIKIVGRHASVLDLGCGTGIPILGYLLNQGLQVLGVDASHRMLEIARRNFPSVRFIQADMRELSLNKKFDSIIAWNSFFHLPVEDQPSMFRVFKDHLKNGGILLFTSGKELGEAWGVNGGINLFHGSLDKDQYQTLLKDQSFRVIKYKEDDPQSGNATVWIAQLE